MLRLPTVRVNRRKIPLSIEGECGNRIRVDVGVRVNEINASSSRTHLVKGIRLQGLSELFEGLLEVLLSVFRFCSFQEMPCDI